MKHSSSKRAGAFLTALLIAVGGAFLAPSAAFAEEQETVEQTLEQTVEETAELTETETAQETQTDAQAETPPETTAEQTVQEPEAPATEPKTAEAETNTETETLLVANQEGTPAVASMQSVSSSSTEQVVPQIVVSKTEGINPEGETVTVTGSGFLPSAPATSGTRPPLMGKFTGVYVVFGSFLETWQPSVISQTNGVRNVVEQKWAVPAESMSVIGGPARGAIELHEDGTFTTELIITKDESQKLASGKWGVYTYPGGGATYSPFELYTSIAFEGDEENESENPSVKVHGSIDNLDPEAEVINVRVTGSGFFPHEPETSGANRPPLNGKFAGTYVIFGSFDEEWKPSVGVPAAKRKVIEQKWAVPEESFDAIGGADRGAIILQPGGTFDTTLNISIKDKEQLENGRLGIYTYVGGGAIYAPFETYTPVSFKNSDLEDSETPEPEIEDPKADLPDTVKQSEGRLIWGVSNSFVDYIEGNIATGKITVQKPATRNKNLFTFPQAKGSTWSEEKLTGTLKYAGIIEFTGHEGLLNVAIPNPEVTVKNTDTADLSVMHDGKKVVIAKLDLKKAKRTKHADGSVTWANAPTTVTKAGADQVFAEFYLPGQSLDPITFTAGSGAKEIAKPGTSAGTADKKVTENIIPSFKPAAVQKQQQGAGSLTWGISTDFYNYTRGNISRGSVSQQGVGGGPGGYIFPQAAGSSWNTETQTGTIHYSGVVTFIGHHGLMNVPFANPTITVHNATTGSITVSGQSYTLNLAAANKTENADGTVTWTGVPVAGTISGSGPGGGGQFGIDSLSFTAGSAGGSFGSAVDADTPEDEEEKEKAAKKAKAKQKSANKTQLVAATDIEPETAAAGVAVANSAVNSSLAWIVAIGLIVAAGATASGVALQRRK